MSDKRGGSDEKAYWDGVQTQRHAKHDKSHDRAGWGERKAGRHSENYSWERSGSPKSSSRVSTNSGWASGATANRDAVSGSAEGSSLRGDSVNTAPVKSEPSGTEVYASNSSAARPSSSSFMLVAGVIGSVILLLLIAISMRNGKEGASGAAANVAAPAATSTSAFVNTKELNLRSGPGSEYASLTKLAHGTEVIRLGVEQSADGGSWARVQAGSAEGWVNQKLITDSKPPPLAEGLEAVSSRSNFNEMVVSLGTIGGTSVIGMTVGEAGQTLGRTLVPRGEAIEGCSYVVPEDGDGEIALMVIGGRIARIDINGKKVSYEGGIRIGDSEAKVKSLFGNRLEIEPHTYVEGKYLKHTRGNLGVVFETEAGRVTSIRSGRKPEFEYVEGCL